MLIEKMRVCHDGSHEHITMVDLQRVAEAEAADADKLGVDEMARYYEIEDKIAKCRECRRRVRVATVAQKVFKVPIWELGRDAAFTVDLRKEASLGLID